MATQQYTVKAGDNLSKIAKQFGTDTSSITGYKSGNPNLIYPGETLTLSNTKSTINASEIKPSVNLNLPSQAVKSSTGVSSVINKGQVVDSNGSSVNSQVEKYRQQLEKMLNERKSETEKKMKELQAQEKEVMGKVESATQPFRQQIETTERDRLYVNKNFEENQKLVDELDTLLTEGNNLIKQQQSVTGLSSIRNPRIQQTMNDVASRTGVIEAVINARNGQISVAENLIDRTINAITLDRQDELSYYEKVLALNNQKQVSLDEDSKKIAEERMNLIKVDLNTAQATADYLKKLMIDPSTATLVGQAGVSLNDSVETINKKLQKAEQDREIIVLGNEMAKGGYSAVLTPDSVPANKLVTVTDSRGGKHYYRKTETASSSGFDTNAFVKSLKEEGYMVQEPIDTTNIWSEVLTGQAKIIGPAVPDPSAPKFIPSGGVGTLYTDANGQKWRYTLNSWVRV